MVIIHKKKLVSSLLFLLFFFFLLVFSQTASAIEILYQENFQANRISEDWVFYGDPISRLSLEKGNPAPSFNNNGDSMGSSGIKSLFSFPLNDGICLQADVFITCHPRGTWVGIDVGFYNINSDLGTTNQDMMPTQYVYFNLSYDGELAWHCPHIETTLGLHSKLPKRNLIIIHQNQYLGSWLKCTLELFPNESSFFIEDSLIFTLETSIPDSVTNMGIFIGGRATSWGTALVDNLIVYRP